MRFLVDNALSPALAALLSQAAHDAVLVRDLDLQSAPDTTILEHVSVIQFRGPGSRRPEKLAELLLANLPALSEPLETGSIVTIEPGRIRVRSLRSDHWS